MIFTIVYLLLSVLAAVFTIAVSWKMLVKCGEKGWKCLIPVYGTYVRTCCATKDERVRKGVLFSAIAMIVSVILFFAFGAKAISNMIVVSGNSFDVVPEAAGMSSTLADLSLAVIALSSAAYCIFVIISNYMLGLTFDEDRSLGILMAFPATTFFASVFVVFDQAIEYGGALGDDSDDSDGDEQ